MSWILTNLWLIPVLPLLAAGISALLKRPNRSLAAGLAIGSLGASFLLSLMAFAETLGKHGPAARQFHNFDWFALGDTVVRLGWVLDPLTAAMVVMITFVGSLIFIFSVGYMSHDENFTRFFCFLSLFAAAMLGLIIANNLLLLFMCWELVGLASYLLIGFWFHKPSAAAAAKKAFITTRIGDVFFFLGIVWLYSETGTLLFYDGGRGCLEQDALSKMVAHTTIGGLAASSAIGLLLFCGAIGKSGQVPLHVWLPDAMEGPTPVSALIHAATMVAAGVFLVARVYPLMEMQQAGVSEPIPLTAVTWIGALTAIFGALVAVSQTDIKRILAYSTVSQLGYMMMGLGIGGVAVGMFHLLTHAFFKALLFLGSGSIIHGCHEEQDIRRMGGIRKFMPVTFATYAIGMMALSGVPLVFCGFWSKDEILTAAWLYQPSKIPFFLGLGGAFLTAFYMTRQMCFVFAGKYRGGHDASHDDHGHSHSHGDAHAHAHDPHESTAVMTLPLQILAACTVLLTLVSTPLWPWLPEYLVGEAAHWRPDKLFNAGTLTLLLVSAVVVGAGIGLGWWFYGLLPAEKADEPDPLEQQFPEQFAWSRGKFFVDELYAATFVKWNTRLGELCHNLDRRVLDLLVSIVGWATTGCAVLAKLFDEFVVNKLFDAGCGEVRRGAEAASELQGGQIHQYLRSIGLALVLFVFILAVGCNK
ncbi:MAG: NADH-quinone oxidoreductase subunit L [Limisphaerales bacterium]|nr:MAG: NADH-quinone oxidoreductase subunit L [Limisphaerales bacterium]KAG0509541.1 MAG: NADH-quinone oxidoreductase subunit L [Limisphaerales bacterium]TXT52377.1 MAG: NADH-quinone oxidoreductase subunit L [Limisphaerales bacterium]